MATTSNEGTSQEGQGPLLPKSEGIGNDGSFLLNNRGVIEEIKNIGTVKDGKLHVSMKKIHELMKEKGFTVVGEDRMLQKNL